MKTPATLFLAAAFVLTASAACAQSAAWDAAKGKKLFMEVGCQACHGRTAQGVGGNRKLAPKPIPLAAGIAYVRKPAGQMIAYSPAVLSDGDLADIWAYLRTIPDNPSPGSIEILKGW